MRKYQHGRVLLAAHRSISANSESVDHRVLNTLTSLIVLSMCWAYFTTCGDINTISRQAGSVVSSENNVSLSLADSPAACLL